MTVVKHYYIKITGIVQGVGFRPFVYKVASQFSIKGYVLNYSGGVIIEAEQEQEILDNFIEHMINNKPKNSSILDIQIIEQEVLGYNCFKIEESKNISDELPRVPADTAICEDCQREILDKDNKYHRYPFISCAICGPRFTMIESLPYDRVRTSMKEFHMCDSCDSEYTDPLNKRYHAESTACHMCGPELEVYNTDGKAQIENPIEYVNRYLEQDKIIALKGIGGYHIMCDAFSDIAISTLRERKKRSGKPLAVMMKDIETVKKYCYVKSSEEELLLSSKAPIVILKQKQNTKISSYINDGLGYLGVMLPYTGVHKLLFEISSEVLVCTSGNISENPIIIENDEAISKLSEVCDIFLSHNREILRYCDDSVLKVIENKPFMIRRSRGYTPNAIKVDTNKNILALGASQKNTFCIATKNNAFLSQHIGDMDNFSTYESFKSAIKDYEKIFNFVPEVVVVDLHKGYLSTQYGQNLGLPMKYVQHHHAHIASVLGEKNIEDNVIGLAFDGTGLGDDNHLWGCEFLMCNKQSYKRVGHLKYINMPTGKLAIKEPYRMALAYLNDAYGTDFNRDSTIAKYLEANKYETILKSSQLGINTIKTSSAGRLFDGISSIIGLGFTSNYEGSLAIELEKHSKYRDMGYDFEISKEQDEYIIDYKNVILGIYEDVVKFKPVEDICGGFHKSFVDMCIKTVERISEDYKIFKVALSGGVFQNNLILLNLLQGLRQKGFEVFINSEVPCNDGGISFGQVIVCGAN